MDSQGYGILRLYYFTDYQFIVTYFRRKLDFRRMSCRPNYKNNCQVGMDYIQIAFPGSFPSIDHSGMLLMLKRVLGCYIGPRFQASPMLHYVNYWCRLEKFAGFSQWRSFRTTPTVYVRSPKRRLLPTTDCETPSSPRPWDRMNEKTRSLVKNLEPSNLSDDKDPWKRRRALSQAVTLVESSNPNQQEQAALLLTHLLQNDNARRNHEFRVGIAGAPGAGKSTFIEALGRYVLNLSSSQTGNTDGSTLWIPPRLAVICIDPSSSLTGGSILGDKTRMVELSRHANVFVRPAPTSGALGGLAPHTDDALRLAAAADYPLLFIETVGLGQSEIEVRQSVDMVVLLVPPAGGDELQGVKKGIVEVADLLVVTKADGNLLPAAKRTASDYKGAMSFVHNINQTTTPVLLASSVTGEGLAEVWEAISKRRNDLVQREGDFLERRKEQRHYWMWKNFRLLVERETRSNPELQATAKELIRQLDRGSTPPRVAAAELLRRLKETRS